MRVSNSQGVDPKVETLVGLDKGKSPLTMRCPKDALSGES